MKNLIWRVIYAAVVVVMVLLILPLFLSVVGFPVAGNLWALIRLVIACLAVLYVVWGPEPKAPW